MIDTMLMISGILLGTLFGFVLQRGRFCMNSAFRDIILMKDYTLLKAVVIAIVVQLIGFHLMGSMDWIQLNPKPFLWAAVIVGGFIFGIGMVLAAGCASGTTYRVGEGMVGSLIALLGLMIGTVVTKLGALSWLDSLLKTDIFKAITTTDLGVDPGPYLKEGSTSLTLANMLGLNPWILVGIIAAVVLIVLIWKRENEATKNEGSLYDKIFKKGWNWWVTGIAVGIVGLMAFPIFKNYALGVSGGWFSFLNTLITGDANNLNWFAFLVMGIIVGSAISALIAGEFKLRAPTGKRIIQQFIGGLVMGIGAIIGTACNIGHILTGIPQLSVGSIVGGIFIILGSWVAAYLMFMRD